jgi:fructose-bisphosphate aldolase class I
MVTLPAFATIPTITCEEDSADMTNHIKDLETTIAKLAAKGKGILAADESNATITKRFEALNIASTADTRRAYRELLVTTPGINEYIAGVILFEETLNQTASTGEAFPELLKKHGILPGIKVDKGLAALPNTTDEQFTQGLDGLNERQLTPLALLRFAQMRKVSLAMLHFAKQMVSFLSLNRKF